MMKPIKNIMQNDYALLLIIFGSSYGLNAYTLFKRSKISYPSFMDSIKKLEKNELISIGEETRVNITELGIKFIFQRGKESKNFPKIWRNIPEKFIKPQLNVNQFYIPNIRYLDKRDFFENTESSHRD